MSSPQHKYTLCFIAVHLFSFLCIIAGITCLALEITSAGVPLIIVSVVVFMAGFLERNCARWQPPPPLTRPSTQPVAPEHTVVGVQPPSDVKGNNLPPK